MCFVYILAGDAILGRIYLKYLCAAKSGIFVNKTIELDSSYFNEEGKFHYDWTNSLFGDLSVENRYEGVDYYDSEYIKYPLFLKVEYKLIDRKTNEVLATAVYFTFRGGWFERLAPSSAGSCDISKKRPHRTIVDKVFLQRKSKNSH